MGEARNRGTYEQRKAGAIVRDHPKQLAALRAEQERVKAYDRMVMDKAEDIYIQAAVMGELFKNDGKPEAVISDAEPDNEGCLDSQISTEP